MLLVTRQRRLLRLGITPGRTCGYTGTVDIVVPQRHRQPSTIQRALGALAVLNLMVIGLGSCDSGVARRTYGAHSSSAPANSLSATATATGETQALLTWTMPNLVGSNSQSAQDPRLHELCDSHDNSHDATGAGRHQVFDRNWKVCSQSIPPGSLINRDTQIDFGAVKLEERCP